MQGGLTVTKYFDNLARAHFYIPNFDFLQPSDEIKFKPCTINAEADPKGLHNTDNNQFHD